MEVEGRVSVLLPVVSGRSEKSGNEWRRQEFVLEFFEHKTDRYADRMVLSVMNGRMDSLSLKVGDELRVGVGHHAREYNGRWFNELTVYRIEKIERRGARGGAVSAGQQVAVQDGQQRMEFEPEEAAGVEGKEKEGEGDLPF